MRLILPALALVLFVACGGRDVVETDAAVILGGEMYEAAASDDRDRLVSLCRDPLTALADAEDHDVLVDACNIGIRGEPLTDVLDKLSDTLPASAVATAERRANIDITGDATAAAIQTVVEATVASHLGTPTP